MDIEYLGEIRYWKVTDGEKIYEVAEEYDNIELQTTLEVSEVVDGELKLVASKEEKERIIEVKN